MLLTEAATRWSLFSSTDPWELQIPDKCVTFCRVASLSLYRLLNDWRMYNPSQHSGGRTCAQTMWKPVGMQANASGYCESAQARKSFGAIVTPPRMPAMTR